MNLENRITALEQKVEAPKAPEMIIAFVGSKDDRPDGTEQHCRLTPDGLEDLSKGA
jgi:hypothetical protein